MPDQCQFPSDVVMMWNLSAW